MDAAPFFFMASLFSPTSPHQALWEGCSPDHPYSLRGRPGTLGPGNEARMAVCLVYACAWPARKQRQISWYTLLRHGPLFRYSSHSTVHLLHQKKTGRLGQHQHYREPVPGCMIKQPPCYSTTGMSHNNNMDAQVLLCAQLRLLGNAQLRILFPHLYILR
jgi:hypothetical protein